MMQPFRYYLRSVHEVCTEEESGAFLALKEFVMWTQKGLQTEEPVHTRV